jgi:hypothetical protein
LAVSAYLTVRAFCLLFYGCPHEFSQDGALFFGVQELLFIYYTWSYLIITVYTFVHTWKSKIWITLCSDCLHYVNHLLGYNRLLYANRLLGFNLV